MLRSPAAQCRLVAFLTLLVLAALPGQLLAQRLVTFGGSNSDQGRAVAVDASGNAVVTGRFQGTVDFDPGPGVVTRTSAGGDHVFVARYAPDGAFVSVAIFRGIGLAVAVDASGNAVVTGFFSGTVDFDPGAGVMSRTSAGDSDVFVARYAPNGDFVSVATFGSEGYDRGQGVAVDASGNAVVTGFFTYTVDFDPGPGVQNRTNAWAGTPDVFVARYTPDGHFVSVATFGGTGNNEGLGVAVDASGNAVVTGYYSGTVDFDPDAGDASRTSAQGSPDVFVARYAPDGTFVSVLAFGSANTSLGFVSDVGQDVAVDASGNAVVTGFFQGTVDFDPGVGVINRTSAWYFDVFVARYTPDGHFVSVATFGGTGDDRGYGVAVDASGDAVVTGIFQGTVDFDPRGRVQNRTNEGTPGVFVARYTPDGHFVSVATFGGTGNNEGLGVAVDASGNAVVTGYYSGTVDFDPGAGDASHTSAGSNDVFVSRYAISGDLVATATNDERPLARKSSIVLLGTRAVRIELAEAEPTLRVTLYDVLGRTVATLHNGPADTGSLDARLPQGLPSGVYLVRAQGTRFADAIPLVLR